METAGKLVTDEQLKEVLKERGLGRQRLATPSSRLSSSAVHSRTQKTLTATDLGRYLVALIQDRALKSAELTGEWEAKLRAIESGRLDPRQFMDEIARYTAGLIRSSAAVTVDAGRLGECPRCGRPVIEGRRGFGCSGWREGCPFVLWRQYKDSELSLEQVRELLQRRRLAPAGVDRGLGLGPVSAPVDGLRGDRGDPRPGRPRATCDRRRGRRPRTPARPRAGARPRRQVEGEGSRRLGPCPLCGSEVVEQERSFRCSGGEQGCGFAIWKMIAGKRIGVRIPQALVGEGESAVLKGFKSKSGKSFDCAIKGSGRWAVRFEFGSR